MKRCLSILAFGLLLLTSCLNELQGGREEVAGPSNIVLNIATKPQTKLGAASDGDVMSNLHIWLVYGTKVEGYLCQTHDDCTISDSGSTATATFENVPRGACTLYLVANLPVDSSLPDAFGVGSTITDDFLKYVLPEVVNYEPPYGASTPGMPLSTSVSLSVGAGTNKVSAELVRTCAKLTITVRNNTTENTIILKDLILSKRNPNIGYLFEQSDYSIPLAADFGEFRPYAHLAGDDVTDVIPQGGERIFVQQYMYETATDGAANLGFQIVGGLFPNGTDRATVEEVTIWTLSNITNYSSGTYLIKSRDNDLYLYNNGGTLELKALNNINSIDDNYRWTFSGTTSVTIKNGSHFLTLGKNTAGLNTKSSNITLVNDSEDFRFRITSGRWNYYLTISKSKVTTTSTSDANCYWNIVKDESTPEQKLQGASVYFDKNIPSLNYINKYGIPVPLEQIRRNQDVKIVVNIHYNPNSGVLFFETCDWDGKDKNHETTFD